jgi:hypothetical protein
MPARATIDGLEEVFLLSLLAFRDTGIVIERDQAGLHERRLA